MTQCQVCDSKLVTDGLISGQQVRCANCQSLSRFGKLEKVATHRLAWRSFWLGLSSILLLTFTGIPAMYYGIRSLLRMRFIKPARMDRAAAIAGTTLGGCFGVFFGFIAATSLILGLIQYWTFDETTESQEVSHKCSQYFEFSSPYVVPVKATFSMNSQWSFDFADIPETDDSNLAIRLVFLRTGIQPNDGVMIRQLQAKGTKQSFGAVHESEYVAWEFDDRKVNIKKSVFSRESGPEPDETEETHRQYWGYVRGDDGLYGMVVVFEPDNCKLTESDVRELFAATRVNYDRP